jgi:alginate O-acetyltransferase complex protein AlgI
MAFSTELFLFAFLPRFLLVYYLFPRGLRNLVAMFGSLGFYAFGAPRFVFVLLASCVVDYLCAGHIAKTTDARVRKGLLVLNLVVSLGLLAYFKYANFVVHEVDALLGRLGLGPMPWTEVALPIGISFFTFHKISYLVDVYERRVEPAQSLVDYLLYILIFPQLIAGPIVRYHDIDQQIRRRGYPALRLWHGAERFVLGLAKKVLVANPLALIADQVFATPLDSLLPGYAWLGATCYFFQIYFDFSGYSDMAIGLGRMMGLELPENFARPYSARTFTEVWRRWHISLSNFMRVYVYIPLGGNRVGVARQYMNLWIVFLLSGLWHGASWNFVAWGAYQGLFLTLDKMGWERWSARVPDVVLRATTALLVLFSWVLFRSSTLGQAGDMLGRMLGITSMPQHPLEAWPDHYVQVSNRQLVVLGIAALVCVLPWSRRYLALEQRLLARRDHGLGLACFAALTFLLFGLSVLGLVNSRHNPFIYFRF